VRKDPAVGRRAQEALARADALAPGALFVRRARWVYLSNVANDQTAAQVELDGILRESPNDASLLSASASADQARGELGTALAKLERARELDPRSVGVLGNICSVYQALDRGADAVKACEDLVSVVPLDATAAQQLAMAHIASGDLPAVRKVLRAAVDRGIPALKLGLQMVGYYEVGFSLDEPDQQAVLRLTPNAFDDSRAWWAQSLATLYWQRGDTARARAFADSALGPTRQLLTDSPNDSQMHVITSLLLAYLGRATEAKAELTKGLSLTGTPDLISYNLINAAKTELALGNRDAALAHLKAGRARGIYVTNGWMRVDPTYASLKGYPPAETFMGTKAP